MDNLGKCLFLFLWYLVELFSRNNVIHVKHIMKYWYTLICRWNNSEHTPFMKPLVKAWLSEKENKWREFFFFPQEIQRTPQPKNQARSIPFYPQGRWAPGREGLNILKDTENVGLFQNLLYQLVNWKLNCVHWFPLLRRVNSRKSFKTENTPPKVIH